MESTYSAPAFTNITPDEAIQINNFYLSAEAQIAKLQRLVAELMVRNNLITAYLRRKALRRVQVALICKKHTDNWSTDRATKAKGHLDALKELGEDIFLNNEKDPQVKPHVRYLNDTTHLNMKNVGFNSIISLYFLLY